VMSAEKRLAVILGHITPEKSEVSHNCKPVHTSGETSALLSGKVAIITGAAQGIGEATVLAFAQSGAKLSVTDLDGKKLEVLLTKLEKLFPTLQVIATTGDITDPSFPDTLMKRTIEKFGSLHILVNNAGYTWDGMLHRMTDKQWDAMLAVHNTAPFRLVRAATAHMREKGKEEIDRTGKAADRAIINVSSTSGLHGNIGQANYATAKMGVVGFTKTVAKEWGPFNVRCNAVAFGLIDTRLTRAKEEGEHILVDGKEVSLGVPRALREKQSYAYIPLRRPGTATEAANAILFLACPLSTYISGITLEVTGGAGI